MSGHTPGPWRVIPRDGKFPNAVQRGRQGGFEVRGLDNETEDADARLIAAAPELLEACQTFAEWLRREAAGSEGQPWAGKRDTPEGEAAWREWWDENLRICDLAQEQARAAIAKATGGSE